MDPEQSFLSPRRLQLLVELQRVGTMAAVTAETGLATSAVSTHLKALEREVGTPLLEPHGRMVRLTPAAEVLVERARGVLTALQEIPHGLTAGSEPSGPVRLAGPTSTLRQRVLSWLPEFLHRYPGVDLQIVEAEPEEVTAMLTRRRIDIGLVYDFDVAPMPAVDEFISKYIYTVRWGVLVPPGTGLERAGLDLRGLLDRLRDTAWITSSRGPEDEAAIRALAARAGYRPRIQHRVDALDLVEAFVSIGLGVALFPTDRPLSTTASLLDTDILSVDRRVFALAHPAWANWPAGRVVLENLRAMGTQH